MTQLTKIILLILFSIGVTGCRANITNSVQTHSSGNEATPISSTTHKTPTEFKFVKFASFYDTLKPASELTNSKMLLLDKDVLRLNETCAIKINAIKPYELDVEMAHSVEDAGSPKIFDQFLKKNFHVVMDDISKSFDTTPLNADNISCPLSYASIYLLNNGDMLITTGIFYKFSRN